MFPLVRWCARLIRLLTVLWAVSRCEANQSDLQPSANGGIIPDQVLQLFVLTVKSEMEPLFNKLDSRIDGLASRIDGLDSRLLGIETRLNTFDLKQNRFDIKQDMFDSRLKELVSRANSMEERFDSRLEELVSRANSTEDRFGSGLEELVSRANSKEERFDSRLEELVSRAESTEDRVSSRLDELVSRLNSTEDKFESRLGPLPRDCSDLGTGARTGVHLLQPSLNRSQSPVAAFCDMDKDGGGWTVIQRRADIKPRQDFYLDWVAYREGFGELDAEFWWGLENVWTLTGPQDRQYELRVSLGDFDGERRHATYGQFRVASEADGYRLLVASYTGDARDALSYHSGQKFSTRDNDQDGSDSRHCAQEWKGAWWYKTCYQAHLNGQYLSGQHAKKLGGVAWNGWKSNYSLKDVEMKIRPVDTI